MVFITQFVLAVSVIVGLAVSLRLLLEMSGGAALMFSILVVLVAVGIAETTNRRWKKGKRDAL